MMCWIGSFSKKFTLKPSETHSCTRLNNLAKAGILYCFQSLLTKTYQLVGFFGPPHTAAICAYCPQLKHGLCVSSSWSHGLAGTDGKDCVRIPLVVRMVLREKLVHAWDIEIEGAGSETVWTF